MSSITRLYFRPNNFRTGLVYEISWHTNRRGTCPRRSSCNESANILTQLRFGSRVKFNLASAVFSDAVQRRQPSVLSRDGSGVGPVAGVRFVEDFQDIVFNRLLAQADDFANAFT
jgi:hypothetical protein